MSAGDSYNTGGDRDQNKPNLWAPWACSKAITSLVEREPFETDEETIFYNEEEVQVLKKGSQRWVFIYIYNKSNQSHGLDEPISIDSSGKKKAAVFGTWQLDSATLFPGPSSHGYLINVKPCFNINIPSYNYSLCHAIHYNMPFHTKFSGLSLL